MNTKTKTKSSAVRERLTHPIIDADGHTVEYLPLAMEFLREEAGAKIQEEFASRIPGGDRNYDGGPERIGGRHGWYELTQQQRRDMRVSRASFWGVPTTKTLDRATVMLPNLFRERIDDLGLDFAIVYGTYGLDLLREQNPELRIAGCRAMNKMYAELFLPHADRMTMAAVIPTGTPQEALDELDFAIGKLGMKAVVLGTTVRRPIAEVARNAPKYAPFATWLDPLALSSEYDYDPVWKKCVELGVAVGSHAASMGVGYRNSPENYVYNHIGHFAAAGEAFCKALVLGGVAQRFPALTFAILEGGVAWACTLFNDLIEHWETRNMESMHELLDPAKLDRPALAKLFAKYGGGRFKADAPVPGAGAGTFDEKPDEMDDFKALDIKGDPRRFAEIFRNFFFGCESEDRMAAVAFNPRINHYGARMQAMFSSDIGHFDVRDITKVVADAYELVEDELLTESDFRDFTFANAAKLYSRMNPNFFKGTPVETAAAAVEL